MGWLGHVTRRKKSEPVRMVMEMNGNGSRGRGRPKKRWLEVIQSYEDWWYVCVDNVKYRVKWRTLKFKTSITDPKQLVY